MSLPDPPHTRKQLTTRSVTFRGFERDDGLFDIEAELTDVKTYGFQRPDGDMHQAGSPVHHMAIRVTVDEGMTIRDIGTSMDSKPFAECLQAQSPMRELIGCTMGPGWRHAIEKSLGAARGCTHLRELLFNMATATFQTIPDYREHQRKLEGRPTPPTGQPPYHLGKCMSWDFKSPVVQRHVPEFYGWQPPKGGKT